MRIPEGERLDFVGMGQAASEVVLLEARVKGFVHAVGWKQPRSRKGYWRMSQNEIVRYALNNRWLEEQGVPDIRAIWIVLHYGQAARV